HAGFWRFTPGQRRGVRVAAAEPLYVLRVEPAANHVVVGPPRDLARRRVAVHGRLYDDVRRAAAKLRHHSAASGAPGHPLADGFRLELDEAAYGVAPGQAAVLYDESDAVVGAGLVTRTDGE